MVAKYETFLGCFSMETGGKIVGWVNFFAGVLVTLIGVAMFMMTINELFKPQFNNEQNGNFNSEARTYIDAIVGFLATIIGCFTVYAGIKLLEGTFDRKSKKIKPMIGLYLILIVFTAASNFIAWPYSLAPFISNYYIVMFLFSLRNKFKEDENKIAAQVSVGSVTISQPQVANNGPYEPKSTDPAILAFNSNAFDCNNPRPAPNAPPSYEA